MLSSSNNKQLSFDKTLSQYLKFHNEWWYMLQLKLLFKLNTYNHLQWWIYIVRTRFEPLAQKVSGSKPKRPKTINL